MLRRREDGGRSFPLLGASNPKPAADCVAAQHRPQALISLNNELGVASSAIVAIIREIKVQEHKAARMAQEQQSSASGALLGQTTLLIVRKADIWRMSV
jgi:hypothetical protein